MSGKRAKKNRKLANKFYQVLNFGRIADEKKDTGFIVRAFKNANKNKFTANDVIDNWFYKKR